VLDVGVDPNDGRHASKRKVLLPRDNDALGVKAEAMLGL
jgi:hypothetical protein